MAYDLEEVGLVGSSVYVGDTVSSIRQREGDSAMVGYEEDDFNAFVGTCGRAPGRRLRARFTQARRALALDEVCLERSDHQHFWDAGLPAVVLTDGYPWYHQPGDTPDKLNLRYLSAT